MQSVVLKFYQKDADMKVHLMNILKKYVLVMIKLVKKLKMVSSEYQ